jgi:glycosyltransferase involved in cell wall biosynthesis
MKYVRPDKVLVAGNCKMGIVQDFADVLCHGFIELGLQTEVVASGKILAHLRELRDPTVLKVLSQSSIFAAPLARRALCVAHGTPLTYHRSLPRTLAALTPFYIAAASHGTQLLAVSDYAALHLRTIFKIRVDGVIRPPVHPAFFKISDCSNIKREAITCIGNLEPWSNIDKLLPALRRILKEFPELRVWIIGDGSMRPCLEALATDEHRIEFLGTQSPEEVKQRLLRSAVFVSGYMYEPPGIVEALSQGCAVVMPASGAGQEVGPDLIGNRIHLFSLTMSSFSIADALRTALKSGTEFIWTAAYSARVIAETYLMTDRKFSAKERGLPAEDAPLSEADELQREGNAGEDTTEGLHA